MRYEVGIAVHVTRRRTVEATSPEEAVIRAMRRMSGRHNRNAIQRGDVLYVDKDGRSVAWNGSRVDALWEKVRT